MIENKRGRVGGGVEWSRRVGGEETDTRIRRPSICVLSRRAGRFFVRGIIYRSTFWPRRVAARCVARSIDTGYFCCFKYERGIRVCVGEKIDVRESELIERERRAIYRAVKSFEERIRLDTNSKMQRSISSGQFSRCMYSKGIDLFFRYRDFFIKI